ncbi:hypothetical protein IS446_05940 [Robertkochia sp. 1368]|nr:hypothetical protein [Robertkochia sediminum]MBL7472329.1 hypothetical protein [Robertkochia sediminum]
MKKLLLTVLFVFIINSVFCQNLLDDKYYFVNGTELYGIKKSNDTIFEFKCNSNFKCAQKYRRIFKVLKSKRIGSKEILAIERIDSIPLTTNPIPADRYKLIGFEKLEQGKLKFINEAKTYTLDSLSVIPFDIQFLNNKFGFTYYSESYLSQLKTDYNISPELAQKILAGLKSNTELIELYRKTKTGDIYGSGITAELIATEMIKINLSPLDAKKRLEQALKK